MPIYENDLVAFVPDNCAKDICDLLNGHGVLLHVKRHRYSKSGDFVINHKTKTLKITINGTLDRYSFLITLIHEIAHLYVWENYSRKVKSHGLEWKKTFKELMQPFLNKNVFPLEIDRALRKYLVSPNASTSGNEMLARALISYSKIKTGLLLEHLDDNTIFVLPNGMKMKKIKFLRKRYECLCLDNNRKYSVSPFVAVSLIEN